MELTKKIRDLEIEIAQLNKEAETMSGYTGGDMTGTEYVMLAMLSDIGNLLNKKYGDLCALKLKMLAVTFSGKYANEKFDVIKVSDQLTEAFVANENVCLQDVNNAIDCANKMQEFVVVVGENKKGDSYEYRIDINPTGIEINELTKEKNGF